MTPAAIAAATAIWNAACGPDLSIGERAMRYNTRPNTGGVVAGVLAYADATPAGFVIASALPGAPGVTSPGHGWINAVAVDPRFQRRGIGASLLDWAEGWLVEQGCTRVSLGTSLRTFTPGLPVQLQVDGESFFARRGYTGGARRDHAWDMANDLRGYVSRYAGRALEGAPRARLWRDPATRMRCWTICGASFRAAGVMRRKSTWLKAAQSRTTCYCGRATR